MNLMDSLGKRPKDDSAEIEKNRLLMNPDQLEKAVANMADYYSPTASTKKPKGETYGLGTVEASKDAADPTRGYGIELRDAFTRELMNPGNRGIHPGTILQAVSQGLMKAPRDDGKSLLEKAFEYKKVEDSRFFSAPTKGMPGYDAWLADKRLVEKERGDRESWLPTLEDLATGTLAGAGMGAAIGATGGGLAGIGSGAASGAAVGAGAGMLAGPGGALLGAGVGAVGGAVAGLFGGKAVGAGVGAATGAILGLGSEILAPAAKKIIHKTDWYNDMVGSNRWQDKAKAMLADVAAYAPGALAAQSGMGAVAKRTMQGLPVDKLKGGFAPDVEGKPPVGPGIDLSGERINPEGMWAADGATLSRVPRAPVSPAGLLEAPGTGTKLPPGEGTAFAGGPEGPVGPVPSGFVPELPKLLGAGKGYDWPGAGNLGRAEKTTPFDVPEKLVPADEIVLTKTNPRAQLLLEDLRDTDLADFEAFKKLSNKSYSELPGVPEKSPVMNEEDLFKNWKLMAERGSRPFNPYAESQAIDSVVEANKKLVKARQDILNNPTAVGVMDVVKTKPTTVKPVAGSDIVEKSQNLSPKALQEVGFEPITDPDVKPLTGPLEARIREAAEKDVFVAIAYEPPTGRYRTALAENSAGEIKTKLASEGVEGSPASTALTEINSTVVPTPKQQENAVEAVTAFVSRGRTIEDTYFPKPKRADARTTVDESTVDFKPGQESIASELVAARTPLKIDVEAGNLEAARKAYLDLVEHTPESFKAQLREMADGDEALYKELLDEQNAEFVEWAAGKGFLPADAEKADNISKYKMIAGMAAFGLPAGVLVDHIAGTKADAGWITASPKTVAQKGVLMAQAAAKGLIAKGVTSETVLGLEHFQAGLIRDPKEVINLVTASVRKGTGAGVQYSLMSPYQVMEALFRTGSGKMVNAAVDFASFITAGSRTKDNASRVVKNILAEGDISISANRVKEAMGPVVPLAAKAAKAEVATARLKLAEKHLEELNKKLKTKPKDIEGTTKEIEVEQAVISQMRTELEGLSGATEGYHNAWTEVAKKLAGEHSGVRVSLALEDPTRTLYPWLPKLSRSEEVAVGKLRSMLDQYQVRLKERGIPTRENYFPHSPHPEMSKIYQAEMEGILGGAPYQKFFSRTQNSRPLLPDVSYSMNHYLADIEPRIQNHDFWKRSGWGVVKELDIIKNNPGLHRAFNSLYEGSKNTANTWGNTAARRYAEFEAVHKLFLSPSAGLKHLVKMSADIVSVGPTIWAKSIPDVGGYLMRKALNKTWGMNHNSMKDVLAKHGVTSERFNRQIIDDYMDSAIMSGHVRKYMMDMGIDSQEQVFNTAKKLWQKTQDVGSVWISMAELVDRSCSVSSALQMSAKKGMTVEQAMYGTYDLILKNNFLFNQFNPGWLNNPKIRALFMFQATPFKIFERRFVNAQRSIESVKSLSKEMQAILKQPGGHEKIKADLFELRHLMRDGQSELKANIFIDALKSETDFFGTSMINQTVMDMLTVGAFTYAGAQAGLALGNHFFHLPFLSTMSEGGKAELAVSPLVSGAMQGYNKWKEDASGEDFLLKNVMDRWLGPLGPLPITINKAIRLNKGDIPEIYQQGGEKGYLKYLFAIPGKE